MMTRFFGCSVIGALLVTGALLLAVPDPARSEPAPADCGGGTVPGNCWPMLQHDKEHTGRSPLLGPLFPGGTPPASAVRSLAFYDKIKMSPVLGPNGFIYVGMGWQFCAINPDMTLHPGSLKNWCKPLNADVSPNAAAVDRDGYIYVGDRDNTLYKFDKFGNRLWTYNHGHEGDIFGSPTIVNGPGPNETTIYVVFIQNIDGPGTIEAITQNSATPTQFTKKWTAPFVPGQYGTTSSPAVDANGVLYLGFADGKIRAITDLGTSAALKWKRALVPVGSIGTSPVIGPDVPAPGGTPSTTIYIGSPAGLHALEPATGTIKWTFPTNGVVGATMAQATDGTLYFVTQSQSTRTVYAVIPGPTSGTLKWKYAKNVNASGVGFPIIGADGIVYVGFGNGVHAFNPIDGTLLWDYQVPNSIISSPLLGLPPLPDVAASATQSGMGVLIFGGQNHNMYSITSPRTAISDNVAPDPDIAVTPGLSVTAGQAVNFDASGTHDANGDNLYFSWDFGDGTTASGPVANHAFFSGGAPTVTLTVSDLLATSQKQVTMNVSGGDPVVFCDGFTRDTSDTLGGPGTSGAALGAPCPADTALTWQENSGDMQISSGGKLVTKPVKATHIATVANLAGIDQAVSTDFVSTLNASVPRFGIVLRFSDPLNYYYAYRLVGGSNSLRISRVINGVETVLAQTPVPNPALNAAFRMRASVTGTSLSLSLCAAAGPGGCAAVGTTVNATDASLVGGTLGTHIAWQTSATPSYKIDNFIACSGPSGTDCTAAR